MKKLVLLSSLAVFFVFAACTAVPITGRKQLSLVPDSQLSQLSDSSYKQIISESEIITSGKDVEMVRNVGGKIAMAAEAFLKENGLEAEISSYSWEFNLIKDDATANAFCMPGGKIAVYTGILPATKNETGLAVVVGHEVAHAIAKHGSERMSQSLIVEYGGAALAHLASEKPQETQNLVMTVYGAGANVGLILPYSRKHELEADRIGLILMARAGYDPSDAVRFWETMSGGASSGMEILSTHPSDTKRISEIKQHIPEAMEYYQK